MLGKIEGRRRRGRQRMRWLDGITNSTDESEQVPGDSEGQGSLACCSPWGCKELDNNKKQTKQHGAALWYRVRTASIMIFLQCVRIAKGNQRKITLSFPKSPANFWDPLVTVY